MKIKKEVMIVKGMFFLIMGIMIMSFVSAGIGVKWEKESALVDEGKEECMTYGIYNPFEEDSFVTIELSDELKEVMIKQEADSKLIPAGTSSDETIPVEFCFKVPKVYEEDCLIGGSICKQECNEEQKTYNGEVLIKSVPSEVSGGSGTQMVFSAPLNLKINCNAHSRNLTLVYVILAILCLIVLGAILWLRQRPELKQNI